MIRKLALLLVAMVAMGALAAIGWWWPRAAPESDGRAAAVSSRPRPASNALGMRDMLRIDPRAGSIDAARDKVATRPMSVALQAFRDRKNYPALLEQLKAGEQSAESLWLQAKIVGECAKRPRDNAAQKNFRIPTPEEERERFMRRLAPEDPQRSRRIAAFETISNKPCGALSEITKTHDEIYEMFKLAAAGGDPRARAEMIWQEQLKGMLEARNKGLSFPKFEVSDEQFQTMKELLASQDPDVVTILGGHLGGWMDGGALVLDRSGAPVNSRAFGQAWYMVACDLGADCGSNSRELLSACAHSGECDAGNLVDYTYFYGASLYHAQLIDQYRQTLLTMIRSGDFSQFRIVRGASPPPAVPPKG